MVESKFTAPHVNFTQKVDAEKLLDLRSQVNEAQETQDLRQRLYPESGCHRAAEISGIERIAYW
jgi:pyruvate/2-oxoglutarate dehydrogenase complex dihydrolipoamide acyltransferase (E2) component